MSTVLPTSVSATSRTSSRVSSTGSPLYWTTTSPDCSPPFAAGPSGTSVTSAPLAASSPSASAMSASTFWIRTPSQPRRVSPKSLSWATTRSTTAEDIAKPMPIEPPLGDRIAVFTPMTSPFMLNSGPPELPRLIAASVWMKSS